MRTTILSERRINGSAHEGLLTLESVFAEDRFSGRYRVKLIDIAYYSTEDEAREAFTAARFPRRLSRTPTKPAVAQGKAPQNRKK